MNHRKSFILIGFCIALAIIWACHETRSSADQPCTKYVGSDKCMGCHDSTCKTWQLTVHRPLLFNKEPANNGCEACHGPGGDHVESADPTKIINPAKLKPEKVATLCMKCHTDEHVTLWRTSTHARAKVSCISCHDPHVANEKILTKDIDNGKDALEGLTRSIHDAELEANTAAAGSKEQADAQTKVAELKKQADDDREALKVKEDAFHRVAEPYVCYNCHKDKQAQVKMVLASPDSRREDDMHGMPQSSRRTQRQSQCGVGDRDLLQVPSGETGAVYLRASAGG